jgi:hypothetical protein
MFSATWLITDWMVTTPPNRSIDQIPAARCGRPGTQPVVVQDSTVMTAGPARVDATSAQ